MSLLKPGVGRLHAMGRRGKKTAEPSNARVAYMLEKSQREPISNDMLDWQIVRGSRQPGPGGAGGDGPEGRHDIPGMSDLKGWPGGEVGRGRLPRSKPPGYIDNVIAHANDTPSVGAIQFADPPPESSTRTRSSTVAVCAISSVRLAAFNPASSGTGCPASTISMRVVGMPWP